MNFFASMRCRLDSHRPVRREVQWNGESYVGTCISCEAPIYRRAHGVWRRRELPQTADV